MSELQVGRWINDTIVFAEEQMSWPLGLFNLLAVTDVKLVYKKISNCFIIYKVAAKPLVQHSQRLFYF